VKQLRLLFICAALLAAILATALASAGTASSKAGRMLYVSPKGSGSSCTKKAPCGSFDRAYRTARPGETVVVAGVGGIGANAIQGAKLAGAASIVAVDPLENKRELAQKFGATHSAASLEEALPQIQELTWGRMADKVIMTMGVGNGELLASALALAKKRGRVVITNIHPALETTANVSLLDLTLMEKQVVGSLFGSGNPRYDIPKLLGLWRNGQLDLDGLVSRTYPLEGVNDGYNDMRDGKNIRGVLVYEH